MKVSGYEVEGEDGVTSTGPASALRVLLVRSDEGLGSEGPAH